jgi:hypothetical protein
VLVAAVDSVQRVDHVLQEDGVIEEAIAHRDDVALLGVAPLADEAGPSVQFPRLPGGQVSAQLQVGKLLPLGQLDVEALYPRAVAPRATPGEVDRAGDAVIRLGDLPSGPCSPWNLVSLQFMTNGSSTWL